MIRTLLRRKNFILAFILYVFLASGLGHSRVLYAEAGIDDAELFVGYLYTQFLGRQPESEGFAFWRTHLESGHHTPDELVRIFFESQEYQNTVGPLARLYRAAFGRVPDSEGLHYWISVFRAGVGLDLIAKYFMQSQEYMAMFDPASTDEDFINQLYTFILGRPAEPDGLAYWTAQLAAGRSRESVMVDFSESEENRNRTVDSVRVTLLYEGLLGRAVTPSELEQGVGVETSNLIKQLLEAGSSISIAIVGLGNDILVTDQPVVTVAGVADSNIPIKQVEWFNSATGESGVASGNTEWQATLSLANGDNPLTFSAINRLGIAADIDTTLTFFEGLDLITPLTLSSNIGYVGEAKSVTFTLGVDSESVVDVTLMSVDENGGNAVERAFMLDNGVLPDEIEGDGIYTVSEEIFSADTGYKCFRAQITDIADVTYQSETACLWITEHFTEEDIAEAVDLANEVKGIFDGADPQLSLKDVAAQAVEYMAEQPGIGAGGSTESGSVWWITDKGIPGAYHPILAGQKANGRGAVEAPFRPEGAPPAAMAHYPADYLLDRSTWQPGQPSFSEQRLSKSVSFAAKSIDASNRVASTRALIVSPYISNPADPINSFGTGDDYFQPWQFLKEAQSCALYPAKEAINNGSLGVSLSDFTDIDTFGYIHYSSHGDNYYSGLLNLWQDEWGPNDWLKGAMSQVVIYSGLKLSQNNDGSYDYGSYEDDIQAKRIILSAGGSMVLTPAYFDHYVGNLPNSLVVLSACRSMYNNSLANVFLQKGAGAVVGYSDYVYTSYAQNTITKLIEELLDGNTVGEAFDAAVSTYGANDGGSDPAYFLRAGSEDLRLSDGTFENLGFESGNLTPWIRSGDGRIISKLGSSNPTEGAYMGIVSTGLGYTVDTGSLSQSGCLSPQAQSLTFDWNFFSEEFLEYCGSLFQDAFVVEICEVGEDDALSNCDALFNTYIDALCGQVSPVEISFDQGDVHATGWQSQSVDVSAYAGKRVQLRLHSTDVGDSIYDSAILLDNIRIDQ